MVNRVRVLGVHPIVADEPVYLVELEIEGGDDGFDFGEVAQEVPGEPWDKWQTAYDEREIGPNRFAFFFHYLDSAKPLLSPAGPLALPPESPIPEHLESIEYDRP
jgi:hypothetical protein